MARVKDAVLEFVTDDRMEPHFFLVGQLALLAAVTAALYFLEPYLRIAP
ncbi:MAG TPA: hypothetical protein VNZ52_00100 [Candidatus Thermoplasmatota archaeon]|nr:hypothetical protein [Candidatus Thermoplasmatota archaeon]